MKKALLLVDIQNDFCENGALAVKNANQIIPYINTLVEKENYDEIILTQDYHPADHKSFASVNNCNVGDVILLNGTSQVMWPDHCIQDTWGTAFHPLLNTSKVTKIIQKGMNTEVDSYSAFFDNNKQIATGLSEYLKSKEIQLIEVAGLALDYCVKYSCLDAVNEGFQVALHFKGTKAVNLHEKDAQETLYSLIQKGVNIIA